MQAGIVERLKAALVEAREALQTIVNGIPTPEAAKVYRTDGKRSKHDECKHGRFMYEDCGSCIEEYAGEALTRIDAALNAGGEGAKKTPDYVYDPDEWDCTYPWTERDLVHGEGDAIESGEVMRVNTLYSGPPKFVANVAVTWDDAGDPDEMKILWFDSEEEAEAAVRLNFRAALPAP